MPEKAFKMQAWVIVGRGMESKFKDMHLLKWIIAGSAAGAATTLIGERGGGEGVGGGGEDGTQECLPPVT